MTRAQHPWTKAAGVGALGVLMVLSLPLAFYAARFGESVRSFVYE